jgi:hypothetical protein
MARSSAGDLNYLPYSAPLHIPEGEAEFLSYLMQIIKLTLS